MAKQHRDGEDYAKRICDSLAGYVWSRAMDGFIESNFATDAGGRQQAQGSNDSSGLIGEDVAEHIFREDDIEICGALDEQHCGGVDILMA